MLTGIKIFTGGSNPELCHAVARELQLTVGNADVRRFSDGEVDVCVNESVREHDVFLVQSTSYPANDHLMELLLLVDACRRASAARVNAVIPYFGYSRQDRTTKPRVPVSAKVVANMLTTARVDRVMTLDLHAPQIAAFFDVPVDHLRTAAILTDHLRAAGLREPMVVSPDAGGVELASTFALRLGGGMALIDRRRGSPAKAKAMHLIGDVEGRDCLLVDDMIDTATTLTEAADLLITSGARSVRAVATHPVLSGTSIERLNRSKISELITTDTIPLPAEKRIEKITVVSVAPLLAAAIRAVHTGESVTQLSGPQLALPRVSSL
jgi:ribose-phosphate pyrophosphokinase